MNNVVAVEFGRKSDCSVPSVLPVAMGEREAKTPDGTAHRGFFQCALDVVMLFERTCMLQPLGLQSHETQAPEIEQVFRRSIDGQLLTKEARKMMTEIRKSYGFTAARMNEHVAQIEAFGMYVEYGAAPLRISEESADFDVPDDIWWHEVPAVS